MDDCLSTQFHITPGQINRVPAYMLGWS